MTTLRQIALDIQAHFGSVLKVTEVPDIRYVYFWVRDMRAKFVKQKLQKFLAFLAEDANTQSLGTIAINILSGSTVVTNPATLGLPNRYVYETAVDIPQAIMLDNGLEALTSISLLDAVDNAPNLRIPLISHARAYSAGSGKFNTEDLFAFRYDKRIYITSRHEYLAEIANINIKGTFPDPIVAGRIADVNYGVDSPYPISEAILEDLKSAVMQLNYQPQMQQYMVGMEKGEINTEGV